MSTQPNNFNIEVVKNNVLSVIEAKIDAAAGDEKEDAFFVADLSDVARKHKLWTDQLPRVHPYYAVKCNEDPGVLNILAQLGTGFDCASKAEIQKVLSLKVPSNRIIYANPCKQSSHIKYAAKHHVARTTFDNETELHKIKKLYPTAKLVLRLLPPDDSKSQCQLGMKYGCPLKQAPHLLQVAHQLDLDVIGVSFHVGSGCYDATAFSAAVASARVAFDQGKAEGFNFTLLDIGGGFPGQPDSKISFEEICDVLRPALDFYFPASSGVQIIAEPGRFYVASAFTLAVNIIAKRAVQRDRAADGSELTKNDQPAFMYYINDGVYGSFNCLLYDHATVKPTLYGDYCDELEYPSSVWGPTCDGLDCVLEKVALPELFPGDWLLFQNMGAYTICAASNFNGMPVPQILHVMHEQTWWPEESRELGSALLELLYVPGYGLTDTNTKRREPRRRPFSEA